MGIYEILPMTAKVQSIIKGETELDQIRTAAFGEGMRTLRLAGAQKVGAGLTTVAEILRVAPVSQDL